MMLIALIQNWCHTIIIIIIALVLKMLFFICIEFVGHLEIIYSCGFAAKCFFVAYFLGLLSNTFEISREIALLSCRTFLKAFSPIQAKMDIFCCRVKYQPVNRLTKYWNSGQWLPDPTSPDSLVPSTSTQVTWTRGTRGEYFSGVNIFQGWIFFTRLPQTAWCRPPPPKSREQGGPVRAQWGKQVGQLGPRTCYLVEREKMASMGRRYAPSKDNM